MEKKLYVTGMHCPSCELIIEKRLKELPGVKETKILSADNSLEIKYENDLPNTENINKLFKEEGYKFFEKPESTDQKIDNKIVIFWSLLLVGSFILLNWLGIGRLINVTPESTWPIFILLGVVAGLSSCAALVGGIILALSKQWSRTYNLEDANKSKLAPHLIFNFGRLIAYFIGGAILGGIGGLFEFSPVFSALLVITISVIMLILGLQMLEIKFFQKIKISLPKLVTGYASRDNKFRNRFSPFIIGALTFFLPCGFTITAQGMALISGDAITGGLILLSFAIGTLPTLLLIGWSSSKLMSKPQLKNYFLKIAGIVILFLALLNINNQLNVLGFSSFNNIKEIIFPTNNQNTNKNLPAIVAGKQIIQMEASASGYSPNYFKVRMGVPVKWEIKDTGTSGCTNAVISKDLFVGQIDLTPGQTSTKEFTINKPGKYKFSCWMGMVTGTIEAADENNPDLTVIDQVNTPLSNNNSSSGTCGVKAGESSQCGSSGTCGCGSNTGCSGICDGSCKANK